MQLSDMSVGAGTEGELLSAEVFCTVHIRRFILLVLFRLLTDPSPFAKVVLKFGVEMSLARANSPEVCFPYPSEPNRLVAAPVFGVYSYSLSFSLQNAVLEIPLSTFPLPRLASHLTGVTVTSLPSPFAWPLGS